MARVGRHVWMWGRWILRLWLMVLLMAAPGSGGAEVVGGLVRAASPVMARGAAMAGGILAAVLAVSPAAQPVAAQSAPASPRIVADGEIVALRTRTSRTYATGRGTRTAEIYPGSIHYQDASGAWQPIDNTLVPATTPGFTYQNKANHYTVLLPGDLGAGPIRVTAGDAAVEFSVIGAHGPGAVAGDVATYAGALPGVSLAYTAGNDGVKEALTLAGPSAPQTFVYSLRLSQGLAARQSTGGGIEFVDAAGQVQIAFAPPFMYDSSGTRAGLSQAVTLTLAQTAAGLTATLAADPAWLASSARKWPVVIDPTVQFQGATRDCDIEDDNRNYCSTTDLDVGYSPGLSPARSRALLFFDLSANIPGQSMVMNAELGVNLFKATTTSSVPVNLHQLTHTWTSSVTWNTFDGVNAWSTPGADFNPTPEYTSTVGSTLGWYYWYPTQLVQGWVSGTIPNNGLILKTNENVSQWFEFYRTITSTSQTLWPKLTVKYKPLFGERALYTFENFGLTDRAHLHVNVASGDFLVHATDLSVRGTGLNLGVERFWSGVSPQTGNSYGDFWEMGTGFDVFLSIYNDGSVGFFSPGGAPMPFIRNSDGSFTSPTGIDATLVKNANGTYTLTYHKTSAKLNFDTTGVLTSQVDKNGNQLTFGYRTDGYLSSITDTQGRVTSFTYVSIGNPSEPAISSMTDSAGRTYSYTYSGFLLASYTDPAGKVTSYSYNANNDLIQLTDPDGNIIKMTYDANFRITSLTRVTNTATGTGSTWNFSYNTFTPGQGGSTIVTDPNGNQTSYTWDTQARVVKVQNAVGNAISTTYTPNSNVQQYTDAAGNVTTYTHDANNNRTSIQLPTGATANWQYADSSHPYDPTSATDAQGNTVTAVYDANGNVTAVTDPLATQNQAKATYNSNGTVASTSDFRGSTTTLSHDAKGNLTGVTPPAPLGAIGIIPDALSRRASITDGKGQKTSYTYDVLDRITQIAYADNSTITYVFDADGNTTSVVDNTGTTAFTYDALSRLIKKTLPNGTTVTYTYDGVGNLTSMTDGGGTVSYHYNALNLVDAVTEPNGAQTTFAYDSNGRRSSTTYPGGTTMTQSYDASQRLSTVVAKTSAAVALTNYTYSYTNPTTGKDTGLVYAITDAVRSTTTTQTYDVLNRLTEWKVIPGTGSTATAHDYLYGYDANGNRASINADGTVSTLTYNAANEWTAAASGGSTANYSWDANGNELGSDGFGNPAQAFAVTYNAKNQTVTMTDINQNIVAMTYSGPGQAERVTAGGASYTYSTTGLGSSTDSTGTTYYTRDPYGKLISQRLPGATTYYYYLFDGDGSVVKIVDASGNVVASYSYCPTGNPAEPDTGVAAAGNPWRKWGAFYQIGFKSYLIDDSWIDSNSGNAMQLGGLPVLTIDAAKMPVIGLHILYAQSIGHPDKLTYDANRAAADDRRDSVCGPGKVPKIPGLSCDEYPFASTFEGGSSALSSTARDASTWLVPARENLIQGGTLRAFYSTLHSGDQFLVRVKFPEPQWPPIIVPFPFPFPARAPQPAPELEPDPEPGPA